MDKFKNNSTTSASNNLNDGSRKEIPRKDVEKAMNKKGSLKDNLNSMRWS